MLIHPWDAPTDDGEWQHWLAGHDFGQLAVNGPPGAPPFVQPMHFAYTPGSGQIVTHLARPNPIWPALEAAPTVLLSVVDDYTFIPGPWQAAEDEPPEHGVPTSFYAAVQLTCHAHIVDAPEAKAVLLQRQMDHFQPEGGSAPVAADQAPYGRQLAGIRGLLLEIQEVRAKFKYAGKRSEAVQQRISDRLAERNAPGDAAARVHQQRRLAAAREGQGRTP
ncbi:FMN-binding negative transcriptional regulator [Streptomyces catenulae]|uniref:FMN-binding negative transcriptional regulator n=1 Tax=Streptomyces catenulae TaxID=66875 RepID=A0ABV2Z4D5_9ACTN|nr:FMN-binding negative transcriptional regulator [Streptomyces catenulae]